MHEILLTGDPQYIKGRIPFKYLHFLIISRLLHRKNDANVTEYLHNVTSVTSNFILLFVPLAAGTNLEAAIPLVRWKVNLRWPWTGCRQIQTTQWNSLDLILMRLSTNANCKPGLYVYPWYDQLHIHLHVYPNNH